MEETSADRSHSVLSSLRVLELVLSLVVSAGIARGLDKEGTPGDIGEHYEEVEADKAPHLAAEGVNGS